MNKTGTYGMGVSGEDGQERNLSEKVLHLEQTLKIFRAEVDMKMKIMEQILNTRNEKFIVQKKLLEREHALYESVMAHWKNTAHLAQSGLSLHFSEENSDATISMDDTCSTGFLQNSFPANDSVPPMRTSKRKLNASITSRKGSEAKRMETDFDILWTGEASVETTGDGDNSLEEGDTETEDGFNSNGNHDRNDREMVEDSLAGESSLEVTEKENMDKQYPLDGKPSLSTTDKEKEGAEKRRALNWSRREKICLVNGVESAFEKIFGKDSGTLSKEVKDNLWMKITNQVNAVGTSRRSVKQIKDQWVDLKSRTKNKFSKQVQETLKTGGAVIDYLTVDEMEENLSSLMSFEKKIVRLNGNDWLLGIKVS